MFARTLLSLMLAGAALSAGAQTSINLSNYQVSGSYALDTLGEMGLEASAVTYAQDRSSLFFVGDEGLGVVEISLTGSTLGTMAFNWDGTDESDDHNDAEGLTYLGNGQLVVIQEHLQDAYRFTYSNSGTATLADSYVSISNAYVGNVGFEGISYDERDGSFVVVKQDNPQSLLAGSLSFASTGGASSMTTLFSATNGLFGLNSLSDVQTLASVDSFAGTAAADNLLILSLDSKMLVEIKRDGTVLSSLDLSGITSQPIEGVTVDEKGIIYLVAEQGDRANSRLLVLTPVPEPESWAMMLGGLALVGAMARRFHRRHGGTNT